jgi:O-antigen/teichoic acid export membrane protein
VAKTKLESAVTEESRPNRSLARSIGKGTLFGVAANLVRYGTRLVLLPIFIAHLGLGGYGIWATLMVIAGYLRFGSAGVKGCFQKYVAEATGTGDFDRANQLVTTGTAIFVALWAAVLIPVAMFPRFLAHLAGIPSQYVSASATAITLLAIAYLIANSMAVFESAVLGAHRVDLMQYYNIAISALTFVFSVIVLRLGYGIVALALVMAIGEAVYAFCALLVAWRVIPQIALRPRYFKVSVIRELIRFTGSYQVLNLMEVFYIGVVPIILLRQLGAEAAGVFAICDRLIRFATMGLESSLVPLLSGSTMIFSAGSAERMRAFLSKAFKLSLVMTLVPLALASAFGPATVLAWTGQRNQYFFFGISLVALTALFRCLSQVGMVLYRSTGGASMANAAQVVRLAILLPVVMLGKQWGFYGAVFGLVVAELAGMMFMLEALFRRLHCFSLRRLLALTAHLSVSLLILIVAAELVAHVPLPLHAGSRLFVAVQLSLVAAVTLVLLWPSFVLTNYLSSDERAQVVNTLFPWRRAALHAQ